MAEPIYKILTHEEWNAFASAGRFEGAAVDLRDGYIHFSTADQVRETAAKHFSGQDELRLVAIDPNVLGNALKWEPSRGGALFPHLYAALSIDAVLWERPLTLDDNGRHVFPVEFTGTAS
ncbi:hypothetical protein FP2506_10196 [Fulvimarina pelagi HTCC2506]|uniref:Dihydroorotate dehydrogenase n=1 Tax=Fulvimarina pelagi HTCC2506 TaxID=314231 RepID=Q0G557_9HYPH|nr:DUF952 domain-containing protein [Fulvimarina pelagi]EAU43207.1 hypothetical protein FP2506_10196 [Fulvimarina pelagi HTCC2506]